MGRCRGCGQVVERVGVTGLCKKCGSVGCYTGDVDHGKPKGDEPSKILKRFEEAGEK